MATATKNGKAWEFGEWGDFASMLMEQVESILEHFKSAESIAMDSAKRNRHDAFTFVRKHKITNEADLGVFEAQQKAEKLKALPVEYQQLERADAENLLKKARARVDFEKYGDSETWKLANILFKRVGNKFNGISLSAFRQLQLPAAGVRTGRAVPLKFNLSEPIPTLAPEGVSPRALEIIEGIKAQFGEDTIDVIGRNKSNIRAVAVVQFKDKVRVSINMPEEYLWPETPEE